MMRSYLGLSLSLCLMFAVGCGNGDLPGTGGTGGTGGAGGAGGTGGMAPSEGVQTKDITLGCSNNITLDTSILPATLVVDSGPISGGNEFAAGLSGTIFFPVTFLDVSQSIIPGGVSTAELIDTRVVVQVRSGATETSGGGGAGGNGGAGVPGVTLVADVASLTPGLTSFCDFSQGTCSTTTTTLCTMDAMCPSGETCTGITGDGQNNKPCDQANDNADGSNPDCLPAVAPGPVCQDPVILVDVPTSDDCTTDGVCDALGKATGTTSQCATNGFCVTGDLAVALEPAEQTYTADASGDVLFGWADQGLTNNTLDPDTGLYSIPMQSMPTEPIEQGLAVNAGGVGVRLACVMAVDSAGPGGVATCTGGDNDGAPCTSPADVGNLICFGGANDGNTCENDAGCPDGSCANADCGPGDPEPTCDPEDLASVTPDSALIRYSIP